MSVPEYLDHLHTVGIRKCERCGDTGEPGEDYGLQGIARIGGNWCLDCAIEIADSGGGSDE